MPLEPYAHTVFAMPPKRDLTRSLMLVSAQSIQPNPNQPRREFLNEALHELMASIAQVGLIQPLTVRDMGTYYELIAGERRLRACKLLGMREIPCIISEVDGASSAVMALTENVQRQNLHFLEEAMSYQKLLLHFGITQEQLAAKLGKSQAFLSNKLRLLKLSPTVRHALELSTLTERHARAMLGLPRESDQLACIRLALKHGWTVLETERYVADKKQQAAPKPLRVMRLSKDYRLFVNGVKMGADQLRQNGMQVNLTETKREDGVDVMIEVRN